MHFYSSYVFDLNGCVDFSSDGIIYLMDLALAFCLQTISGSVSVCTGILNVLAYLPVPGSLAEVTISGGSWIAFVWFGNVLMYVYQLYI